MKTSLPEFMVSRTSILWDGDKHGYPWREVFSEVLYHDQQVVVVSPECDDPCYGDLRRWAKVEPGLKVLDCESVADDIRKHGPAIMHAISEASGQFILHLGCDELVEMEPFMRWIESCPKQLTSKSTAIQFWRWDFTYSSRYITDLWDRMLVTQGIARKWCPPVGITPGAGRLLGFEDQVQCPLPIWHYNGLASEHGHASKHRSLCLTDPKIAPGVGLVDDYGWNYYTRKDGPSSRARLVPRQHPKVMWPWLSKAEMHWRGK